MMWYSETLSFLHTINLAVFAAYAVLITVVLLALLKVYNWLTTGVYRGTTSMKGKTVIVTGANSGNALKTFEISAVYHSIMTELDCLCFVLQESEKRRPESWPNAAPEWSWPAEIRRRDHKPKVNKHNLHIVNFFVIVTRVKDSIIVYLLVCKILCGSSEWKWIC